MAGTESGEFIFKAGDVARLKSDPSKEVAVLNFDGSKYTCFCDIYKIL